MPTRSVTVETLGAWVIKCNPRRTPVDPMRAAGETKPIWCVADGEVTEHNGALQVRVRIPLFAAPVTAAELLAIDGLRSMEVFRSPQQANPSWVSREEVAVLAPLLPDVQPLR